MSPIQPVNFEPLVQIIEQLNAVIHARDDVQIAHQASIAIDYLRNSLLLNLLDTCAQANASQGRFDVAYANSQKMIDHAPEDGAGYLRLANVLLMACRHADVIQTCERALQLVNLSDSQRSLILATKADANRMQQTRADPFVKLPVEISDAVFSQLPKPTAIHCLAVSRLWRERAAGCSSLVSDLWVSDGPCRAIITDAAAIIGQNVEHLTLNTGDHEACSIFLGLMKNAQFTKIKSLKMTEYATRMLRHNLVPLSLALQKIESTLTHLTIEQKGINDTASLADILTHCGALTSLTYDTNQKMFKMIGDFTKLSEASPLINLELITPSILTHEVECILKECQQLRRFVVGCCEFPILEPIINHAPRLEILGYNVLQGYAVPSLDSKSVSKPLGLRIIHCHSPVDGISTVARFIHTYSNTLEVIDIRTTKLVYAKSVPIPTPDEFQLRSLTSLNIGLTFPIQQLILDGIQGSTTLKHVYVYSVNDFPQFISILMDLPPLKTLLMSNTYLSYRPIPIPNMMVHLFNRYARLSKSEQTLQNVVLERINMISDEALTSLGDIRTLQRATLMGLKLVTPSGIETFLEKCGEQLAKLKICDIAVSEDNIVAIARCKRLACLELCSLQNLTDEGIKRFVDELSSNQLMKLTVTACPNVTEEGLQYAKKVELLPSIPYV